MATNVSKALTPIALAPQDDSEEPVLEVEVIEEGEREDDDAPASEPDFDANLAEELEEADITAIVTELTQDIEDDLRSRSDWERTYKEGLSLLGLQYEERTEPWDGACGVFHPMITEAVVRFQSEAIMETFPAKGPVTAKILGEETPETRDAAARVVADMNYMVTERMVEFRSEHERMLWNMPSAGAAFKKVYFDPSLGRPISVFIPAEDIILPYGTSNLFACERVTHRMRKTKNEILRLQAQGFYRNIDVGDAPKLADDLKNAKDRETGFSDINDTRFEIYESHASLVIKGDPLRSEDDGEVALPYVVTMVRNTNHVLAIRRNWRREDPLRLKRQHFVQYDYVPGFGPYGYGLFHLIGGYAKASTSILRQLVDAGTLSNLPGGLKTKGLRIKGDDTPISPGEFRDVDVGSGTIKDNILPLPYKEPSLVLANLLDKIVEEGRRLPGMADMKISDMSSQAPVGTTLALLERQLKVMSAVQARTHSSLKLELQLIKELVRDHGDAEYAYQTDARRPAARREDYSLVEVIPVSDPNAATLSQRVVQYQAATQLAQQAPQVYNMALLHRNVLEVLGIKDADKIVPIPDEAVPTDPVTENMHVLNMKPIKAFEFQNHEAHIAVHTAAMQDPQLMQLLGQNPQAPIMMGAMQAHLAEHAAFAYRQRIEQTLGMRLPPIDQPMPPQIETQITPQLAQAAQAVLAQNQAQAQQAKNEAMQQDPLLQLQQKTVEAQTIKARADLIRAQAEVAEKGDKQHIEQAKLAIDAADRADKNEIARDKIRVEGEVAEMKNQTDLLHVGMMGRAQDQQILQKDRELAARAHQEAAKANAANKVGDSGAKQ